MSPSVLLDTDWVIDHFSGIAAITRKSPRTAEANGTFSIAFPHHCAIGTKP